MKYKRSSWKGLINRYEWYSFIIGDVVFCNQRGVRAFGDTFSQTP